MIPIKKQFEIMDAIRRNEPLRDIAKRFQVSLSTVQDYKKRGPSLFHKYSKNPSVESYPVSVPEEIKWLRQKIEEIVKTDKDIIKKFINQRNNVNNNVEYLEKSNSWKDGEIERLTHEKKEKDDKVNSGNEIIQDLKSRINQLFYIAQKLIDKDERKDLDEKKIKKELEQYKIDLAKAEQLQGFSSDKIRNLTQERDEFKNKFESMERDHEYDWLKNLLGYILSFTGGVVFDNTILPKIKEYLLSLIAEYGKNTCNTIYVTQPEVVIQSDIHYSISGELQVNSTSDILCSGSLSHLNPTLYGSGALAIQVQQDNMVHPTIYYINSGINFVTNTSGTPCSESCKDTFHGN